MSLLPEIIKILADLHDVRGKLTEFGRFNTVLTRLDQRMRALNPGSNRSAIRADDCREVNDEFQEARTVAVLRRLRELQRKFDQTAHLRLRTPYNELEDAREAVQIATEDYGAGSPQERDAVENFARIWDQFCNQLRDSRDEAENYSSRLRLMRDSYRALAQINQRIEDAYGEFVDHPALRALGEFAEPVRRDFLAAYEAFDEIGTLCSQIVMSIVRIREHVQEFGRQLDQTVNAVEGRYREFARRYRIRI